MAKRVCLKCEKRIDTNSDHFVCLGTYEGINPVEEKYFHFLCWREYFEEKTKDKAEVIVKHMQEKMMPIAKQLTEKLKKEIEDRGGSSPLITV